MIVGSRIEAAGQFPGSTNTMHGVRGLRWQIFGHIIIKTYGEWIVMRCHVRRWCRFGASIRHLRSEAIYGRVE